MKNSSDTIGNRTRDLPNCSAVPQTTVQPRAPNDEHERSPLPSGESDRLQQSYEISVHSVFLASVVGIECRTADVCLSLGLKLRNMK